MKVINKLLNETCKLMLCDVEDREILQETLNKCRHNGYVSEQDVKQFVSKGFPLYNIWLNILFIPSGDLVSMIKNKQIAFEDLVCALSIFAQDIKLRSQKKL